MMGATKSTLGLVLALMLVACDQGAKTISAPNTSSAEMDTFVKSVKDNLVFVEGGEFLMGDYGAEYGPEKHSYDSDKDSKPIHKVRLSNFSIGRFKVTNQEYQFYLSRHGLKLRDDVAGSSYKVVSNAPNVPAYLDWYEAEKYCTWLAQTTDLPFNLATEAQWEFAARSRGQFLAVATDDGTYKATNDPVTKDWESGPSGINISNSWDREAFAKERGWKTGTLTPLPDDRFPPNPLGLYAMSDNGLEWVKDWYDPDYYKNSPTLDPQGPDEPVFKDYFGRYVKVVRGQAFANPRWPIGVNVQRTPAEPHGHIDKSDLVFINSMTTRCVVNAPAPVK